MYPVIVWFRRNLRLADNAALRAAVESGRPIIPLYVHDGLERGRAHRWWLHHSLISLDADLRRLGSVLLLRSGPPEEVITELVSETDSGALYFARRYEPDCIRQEQSVTEALEGRVSVKPYDDSFLHAPDTVMSKAGTPYRVFTAFWKTAIRLRGSDMPASPPRSIITVDELPDSLRINDLELTIDTSGKASEYGDVWEPGESAGLRRVDDVESVVHQYAVFRDRPDLDATSMLSPYLAFGEISVRQVWHAIRQAQLTNAVAAGAEALLRQLYWREFSNYLLFHFPSLPEMPLRAEFEYFPWSTDESLLRAWQDGETGFPIVDAGMRQLQQTGWMHNRVRMIVASFLVKDLLVPWQAGAAWFLDNLVDADLANNSAGWQWVAGCGADAAPYFRVFNPTLQAKKFDPRGRYVQQWVPDAAQPSYPAPIVDHGEARQISLEAYASIRGIRTSKQAP